MRNKEEVRISAEALLSSGVALQSVIEQSPEVSPLTIRGWKKKLDAKLQDEEVSDIVEVDEVTLRLARDKIAEVAPDIVVKKIDKLVDGVVGLQQLEPKFHSVVLSLIEKAELMSRDEKLSVRDWSALASGIGSLYANLFNKAGVNVSVLNQTQVSGEKLQMFKSTMRSS